MIESWFKFHWNFFPGIQLTISQHWFRFGYIHATTHHLNQCWNILDRTFRNKLQWNFNKIYTFSFKKKHLKMSSGKWRPFCLGLNVLTSNEVKHFLDLNWTVAILDSSPDPLSHDCTRICTQLPYHSRALISDPGICSYFPRKTVIKTLHLDVTNGTGNFHGKYSARNVTVNECIKLIRYYQLMILKVSELNFILEDIKYIFAFPIISQQQMAQVVVILPCGT